MGSPSPDAVPSRSTDYEKAQLPAGPASPLAPADFCPMECPVLTKPAASPDVHFVTPAGMLRTRAEERPGQVAFTFLADGQTEAGRLTYAELDARAEGVAAALREVAAPGDRALLLFPPGLDFIAAFFGCLYAGVVAVPAYPPRPHDRSQARLRAIARDAEPRVALSTSAVSSGLAGLTAVAPELAAVRWIATDTLASTLADVGG